MTSVQVGQAVKDLVTGFAGIVTGRVEYLTGCAQVLVQPGVKADGGWAESRWFDETRVLIVNPQPITIPGASSENGSDTPAPIR